MRIRIFLSILIIITIVQVSFSRPYRHLLLTSIESLPGQRIETGGRIGILDVEGLESGLIGRATLRYGLSNQLEAAALLPYYKFQYKSDPIQDGIGKINLSLKYTKIPVGPVYLGIMGGLMLPLNKEKMIYYDTYTDATDFELKGLFHARLGRKTAFQANIGKIFTGEGDTPTGLKVDPEDIFQWDLGIGHWVMNDQLMLILEVNGRKQDAASYTLLTPGVRYEVKPGFILEGFGSFPIGDDENKPYNTMFSVGFTFELNN